MSCSCSIWFLAPSLIDCYDDYYEFKQFKQTVNMDNHICFDGYERYLYQIMKKCDFHLIGGDYNNDWQLATVNINNIDVIINKCKEFIYLLLDTEDINEIKDIIGYYDDDLTEIFSHVHTELNRMKEMLKNNKKHFLIEFLW